MAGVSDHLTYNLLDLDLAASLLTGGEVAKQELAKLTFVIYYQGEIPEETGKFPNISKDACNKNKDECIVILTNSLCYNGLEYLEYLDSTPLDLVSGVYKGSAHGSYLPLSIVGALIHVNKFLTLEQSYLEVTSVVDTYRVFLE